MSTYSSSLRIELIGNGEQSGTWGTTTNTNLGTIIESAITNYVNISVNTSDRVLTVNDGLPDESRNAVLVLSTTTAVTNAFNVFAPPVSKIYIVVNNSAYNSTIYCSEERGSTIPKGLGVTVSAGRTSQIWTDGTNMYLVSNSITFPVAVNQGGTGATSFTANNILVGNGTGAITSTPQISVTQGGTGANFFNSGYILTGAGAGAVVGVQTLGITQGGTGTSALINNALLVGNGTGAVKNITPGAAGTVLQSDGTQWVAGASSAGVTSVSVNVANGLAGTVANPTTTPAITLRTSVVGIAKGNGTGFTAAVAGTDYLAPPSGTAIQKANNGGALVNAVAGTDYAPATTGTSILKGSGAGGFSNASAGVDFAPATSGSAILSGNGSGGFSNVTIGGNLTFTNGTLSATGSSPAATNTTLGTVYGNTGNGTTIFSVSLGFGANASGERSVAIGCNSIASGPVTTAVGRNAEATNNNSVALGSFASASGLQSTAISRATASGQDSVAIGTFAGASGAFAVAIGRASVANNQSGIAIGLNSKAEGRGSISIGRGSNGSFANSIILTAADATLSIANQGVFIDSFRDEALGSPNRVIKYNTTTKELFYGNASSGGVTSIDVSGGTTGLTTSGGPVTTSGTITLGGTLGVTNGGTGGTTATDARTNLSAAKSGANTDITSVALTSGTITGAPVANDDIVNKFYADSIASGVNFHQACNYATTTALAANTYNNGSSGVGATLTANANGVLIIDGYTFVAGDVGKRILVKNEVAGANNGIYTLTQAGTVSLPYILTRATDFDSSGTGTDQIDAGDLTLILSGSSNANTSWVQQTPLPITVGTTAIVFIQFGSTTTYSNGTGLSLSSNTFSITDVGTPGTYGSSTVVPVITTNAQGQVTSVTNATISASAAPATPTTLGTIYGNTTAGLTYQTKIGYASYAGDYSTAVGALSSGYLDSVAIGQNAYANYQAVSIGSNARANPAQATIIGYGARAGSSAVGSTIIGKGANTSYASTIIITGDGGLVAPNSGVFMDSFRDESTGAPNKVVKYDTITKELFYGTASTASGTVTDVSVVSANGFAGTVATSTTTPAITLSTSITGVLKGNGTAISAALVGTDYAPATSGTSILYGNGSGGFSAVTIGSNLTFTGGTLDATGGGGASPATNTTLGTVYGNTTDAGSTAATSLGISSSSAGSFSTAIGAYADASGATSTALGAVTTASATQAVAVGRSISSAQNAISMGYSARANGTSAISIGRESISSATNSIAIGLVTYATGNGSIAIGRGANASFANSIVLSAANTALDIANTGVFIDSFRDESAGAPNKVLKYNTTTKELFYGNASSGASYATPTTLGTIFGFTSEASSGIPPGPPGYATALGFNAVSGYAGVSIGLNSSTGTRGTSLGFNADCGNFAVALGHSSIATAEYTVAIGSGAYALSTSSTNSTVIGAGAQTQYPNSIVLSGSGGTFVAPNTGVFINSIRDESGGSPDKTLKYNSTTKEVFYGTGGGGSGTVTDVSVVSANGFSGSVATSTTTPAITLSTSISGILQGNGTAISAITVGTGLSFSAGTLSSTVSPASNATPTVAGIMNGNTTALSTNSWVTTLGVNGLALNNHATSIGANSSCDYNGVAVGFLANATSTATDGGGSIAVGRSANSRSPYGLAIGYASTVNIAANNSIAIGRAATTSFPSSVVLTASGSGLTAPNAGVFIDSMRDESTGSPNKTLKYNTTTKELFYGTASSGSPATPTVEGILYGNTTALSTNSYVTTLGINGLALNNHATSIGANSSCDYNGVAVGFLANATSTATDGGGSIAVGRSANSKSPYGLAIGYAATVNLAANNSIAIGRDAVTSYPSSVVLTASGLGLTVPNTGVFIDSFRDEAVGSPNKVIKYNTATKELFYGSASSGSPATPTVEGILYGNTTAISTNSYVATLGINSVALNNLGTAVGANSTVDYNGVAIGALSQATSTATDGGGSIAIGRSANTGAPYGLSIGYAATVSIAANNSVAIGRNAVTSYPSSVVLTASGSGLTAPNAGVFIDSMRDESAGSPDKVLKYNTTTKELFYGAAGGSSAATSTTLGTVYGNTGDGTTTFFTGLGYNSAASGANSVALGTNSAASSSGAVSVGWGSISNNQSAVAIGKFSGSNGVDTIAIGVQASAKQQGSIAIGGVSIANGTAAVAIGNNANASFANTIVISGTNTALTAPNAGLFIDTIRDESAGSPDKTLKYNSTTKEIFYGTGGGGGSGTVTSIDVSGGTTGLTTSGGPVTTSGTITLSGTLGTANGGTGLTSLGTGVTTALGINVGSAGAVVVNGGALGTPSSGILSGCTVDGTDSVGFRNIPINSQSAAYTLVLADSGKAILHPSTDANARTFTIPDNASVAYPLGTALTFINMTSQVVSIAITSDTLYMAGTGSGGTRSLAQYGMATAIKMTSTTWIISGNGLT